MKQHPSTCKSGDELECTTTMMKLNYKRYIQLFYIIAGKKASLR